MQDFDILTSSNNGNYTTTLLMSLDSSTVRFLVVGMAASVLNVTNPTSPHYIDPVASVSTDPWITTNFQGIDVEQLVIIGVWWAQVKFLHAITKQHMIKPFMNFTEPLVVITKALTLAKMWRDTELEEQQRLKGKHWGTNTEWAQFNPTQYV